MLTPDKVIAIDVYVSARVYGCGDGIVDFDEQCDGNSVSNNTCSLAGFSEGTLSCTSSCTYDTSACVVKNNSSIGGGSGGGVPNFGQTYDIFNIFKKESSITLGDLEKMILPKNSVIFEGISKPYTDVYLLYNKKIIDVAISDYNGRYSLSAINIRNQRNIFTVSGETGQKRFEVDMFSNSIVKFDNISFLSIIKAKIAIIINDYIYKYDFDINKNQTRLLNQTLFDKK